QVRQHPIVILGKESDDVRAQAQTGDRRADDLESLRNAAQEAAQVGEGVSPPITGGGVDVELEMIPCAAELQRVMASSPDDRIGEFGAVQDVGLSVCGARTPCGSASDPDVAEVTAFGSAVVGVKHQASRNVADVKREKIILVKGPVKRKTGRVEQCAGKYL